MLEKPNTVRKLVASFPEEETRVVSVRSGTNPPQLVVERCHQYDTMGQPIWEVVSNNTEMWTRHVVGTLFIVLDRLETATSVALNSGSDLDKLLSSRMDALAGTTYKEIQETNDKLIDLSESLLRRIHDLENNVATLGLLPKSLTT